MKNRIISILVLLIYSSVLFGQNNYAKPNIYAVIIGISNYKDSIIPNLKFPEKDAAAFYEFLRSPNSGSIPDENIALLTGVNATRANIYKQLIEKFSRSNKNDMIIFYFSGHGKAGYDESGYLLPYDTEIENEAGTALSMPEIKERIEKFNAKIQVSYVDACHAGLFTSPGKGMQDDINAAIAKSFLENLVKSDKAAVRFLASSARQQSLEDKDSGHGVFTQFLLKGLMGEADLSQKGMPNYDDGVVSIGELNTYLSANIPPLTKYKQTPSVAGLYNDEFPLSVLRPNLSLLSVIGDHNAVPEKNLNTDTVSKINGNTSPAQNEEITCPDCKGVGTISNAGNCPGCFGKGIVVCNDCSGYGKFTCKKCGGSGQGDISPTRGIWSSSCTACNGTGAVKCRTCTGKGKMTCTECSGSGTVLNKEICGKCMGTGKIKFTGNNNTSTSAGNKKICDGCGGQGIIKTQKVCEDCDGKGRITCSNCHGVGSFGGMFKSDARTICTACLGKGALSCNSCSGKGLIISFKTCTKCYGTGFL